MKNKKILGIVGNIIAIVACLFVAVVAFYYIYNFATTLIKAAQGGGFAPSQSFITTMTKIMIVVGLQASFAGYGIMFGIRNLRVIFGKSKKKYAPIKLILSSVVVVATLVYALIAKMDTGINLVKDIVGIILLVAVIAIIAVELVISKKVAQTENVAINSTEVKEEAPVSDNTTAE